MKIRHFNDTPLSEFQKPVSNLKKSFLQNILSLTFSFLCIFIFYVVKFCAMMPKIFYLVSQQFMVESQSHIFFFSFMLTFTTPPSIHYTTIGLKHILGKIKRGWGCNTRLLVLLYLALLYLAVTYTRLSFGIIQPQKIWKVFVQNTIKN